MTNNLSTTEVEKGILLPPIKLTNPDKLLYWQRSLGEDEVRRGRLSQFHILFVGITIGRTILKGNLKSSIKGHEDTSIL